MLSSRFFSSWASNLFAERPDSGALLRDEATRWQGISAQGAELRPLAVQVPAAHALYRSRRRQLTAEVAGHTGGPRPPLAVQRARQPSTKGIPAGVHLLGVEVSQFFAMPAAAAVK